VKTEFIKNFIDGQAIPPVGKEHFANYQPATGKPYSMIPDSDERDVELAVAAAKKAFPSWSTLTPQLRFRMLNRLADIIEQNHEKFALAESIDTGKPLSVASNVDIERAQANFRFFATATVHFASESHFMEDGAINYTLRQPLGVVGCISPWNLPLYLLTWKIAPAVAAGNCVVAKPSEVTPMTAYLLGEAIAEAGIPPGVINLVHGYGHKAGSAIVKHPDVKAISFTGGTSTGREIARVAAPMFKKLSLELGGKNPNIIFNDCDFDTAVSTSVRAAFSNQGQICLCGSRIFVQSGIYEAFRDAFVRQVQLLRVGDPADPETHIGALVSKAHLEKIESYIELAESERGKLLYGGQRINLGGALSEGYFLQPTVLEGLSYNCRTNQEEIFGPVVTLTPFDTEEQVLGYANSTEYGLAAMVWTQDISRAHRVAERLQSGIVWINCWMLRDLRTPFGGVKNSGVGREGGWEVFRFFTEPKNVCVKYR
jgi:aminomuconate-semialdehyde/2-hydroxymuconate-6-semialdehyde dehydrogenase